MVPYGLNPDQFSSMYRQRLARLSRGAIDAIRTHLALPIGLGVERASIVMFIEENADAPAAWIYYEGANNRVDSKDMGIFPGRSMELAIGLEQLSDVDERYFSDPDAFPGVELSVPLLSRWLAECWWKAGGWSYPLPTVLNVHDFGNVGREVLAEGESGSERSRLGD